MAQEREAVLVRLDSALKERLVAQAKRNDRSANAEASRIIRQDLERNASAPGTSMPDITQ